jgi:hypothetical protein
MNEDLFVKLKFPIIFPQWDDAFRFKREPWEKIGPNMQEFLLSYGIETGVCRRIPALPNSNYNLHTDTHKDDPKTDVGRLNFVFNANTSYLAWYELLPDKSFFYRPDQPTVPTCHIEDCKEIYRELCPSAEDGYAGLINVSTIHTMHNGPSIRICYSLMMLRNKQELTFSEAKNLFKEYKCRTQPSEKS